jgi:hypothetical protein
MHFNRLTGRSGSYGRLKSDALNFSLRLNGRIRVEIAIGVRPVQIDRNSRRPLIFAEPLPGHDSATRLACQESSAVPGYLVGTAVSVNSFTVDNN